MKTKERNFKSLFVAGFAMFATFFGAGNLIFPPALGVMSGEKWLQAFLGYYVADVILALLGVFVIVKYEGDITRLSAKLGKGVSRVFLVALLICLGPLVVIPRTATVTFSMAIKPVLGIAEDAPIPLAICSILFFVIVAIFTIRPGKVVDIVGKYMTPVLLILLLITIIVGVIKATNGPGEVLLESPVKEGILNGYQTCDGLVAIAFTGVLLKASRQNHPENQLMADKEVYNAGVIAAILLFIVYIGLCYLGVTWGKPFAEYFMGGAIDQAGLLDAVVGSILGWTGIYMIALITIFACLTTAIGMTAATAENLEKLFNNRISYKKLVYAICILSLILANVGLKQILAFANPILNLMYPMVITLIILGLLSDHIKGRAAYILGTATALAVSLLVQLCDNMGINALSFVHKLPLDAWGMSFVLPTLIAVVVGVIIGAAGTKTPIEE